MNSNKIKTSSNKSFGIVFFVFFLIISLFPLLKDNNIRIWAIIPAIIFLILGFLNSPILTPLNKISLVLFISLFCFSWTFPFYDATSFKITLKKPIHSLLKKIR